MHNWPSDDTLSINCYCCFLFLVEVTLKFWKPPFMVLSLVTIWKCMNCINMMCDHGTQVISILIVLAYKLMQWFCKLCLTEKWMHYFLKQYHPDMNKSPGAEDKFKEISAAYEVTALLQIFSLLPAILLIFLFCNSLFLFL